MSIRPAPSRLLPLWLACAMSGSLATADAQLGVAPGSPPAAEQNSEDGPDSDTPAVTPQAVQHEVEYWRAMLLSPEMRLTPEQKAQAQQLLEKIRTDLQALRAQGLPTPLPVPPSRETLQAGSALIWQRYHQDLSQILSPEQTERLKLLRQRVQGYSALGDDEVATRLGLTETQRDAVRRILKESEEQRRVLTKQGRTHLRDERIARRKARQDLRRQTQAQLKQVLTPQQAEKFNETQGVASVPSERPSPIPTDVPSAAPPSLVKPPSNSPVQPATGSAPAKSAGSIVRPAPEPGVELGEPRPLTRR